MHLACFTNNHTKFQSHIRGVCRRFGPVARYQEGHWEKAPESKLVVTARWVDCWPCFEATQWKTRLLYFRLVLDVGHRSPGATSLKCRCRPSLGRGGRTFCGSKDSPTGDALRPTGSGEPDDRSHQVSRCRAAWRCCHDAVVTFSEMGRSQFSVASGNLTLLL
jgi:hypothetical protein